MKIYTTQKTDIRFLIKINNPIVLDLGDKWGGKNIQNHEECWGNITQNKLGHMELKYLIASDSNGLPVGYTQNKNVKWLFNKNDVFAKQIKKSQVRLNTLDGVMDYPNPDHNGWLVYNVLDDSDEPNMKDVWFMSNTEFESIYKLK